MTREIDPTVELLVETLNTSNQAASAERREQTAAFTGSLDRLGGRMVRAVWLVAIVVIVAMGLIAGVPVAIDAAGFKVSTGSTPSTAAQPTSVAIEQIPAPLPASVGIPQE